MAKIEGPQAVQAVRVDFVPKDGYLSREHLRLEHERLWPRVWQVACREEEIPHVGDFVTFDVVGESIIVVRTAAERIEAFYNACQHRGRRLTQGCGHAARFMCKYHGWTWNLDGSIARVLDREDWQGCDAMDDTDLHLKSPLVDRWAGFVFINMDTDAEPLATYLAPVPERVDKFEFEAMRYRWYKSVRLPCNWKVALEAFNEGYHVAATHPQILDTVGDDRTQSFTFGRHGMFGYPAQTRPLGSPSPRTGKPVPADLRPGIIRFHDEMEYTLKAIYTDRDASASRRLLTENSADDDFLKLFMSLQQYQQEAALAAGAGWPALSLEDQGRAGTDWHVFPNLVFLMYPDGALFYRARPDGDNPDSCIYDIWSLARYAPGAEPPVQREEYYGPEDYKQSERFGLILSQDFQNMGQVQQGMKSRGFGGARPSPVQERAISNFHRALHEYLFDGVAK